MPSPYILGIFLLYLLFLAFVAWSAERRSAPRPRRLTGVIYALTLGVTFSSWSYSGAVGRLSEGGWSYFPNIVGTILALTVAYPIWRRIAVASKRENIGSIADFMSSRYGKNRRLGALSAWVALIGVLPFIGEQLYVIARTVSMAAGHASPLAAAMPAAVVVLALFAVLLGARSPTLTRHNRGLLRMTAVESLVKLTALLVIAGLAVVLLTQKEPAAIGLAFAVLGAPALNLQFLVGAFNGMVLAITWPRLFHLGFVELEDVGDLKTGRWLFPLYVAVWGAAIIPIALAARLLLAGWGDQSTAMFGLPETFGGPALSAIAFLGAFSTSAALVLVEAIAVSAMISNEILLPWLARSRWATPQSGTDSSRMIVNVRRAAIVGILLAAWFYVGLWHRLGLTPGNNFLSLVLTAQLAPGVVGGVLWRRGHAKGAIWGIIGGSAAWVVLAVLPRLSTHGAPPTFSAATPALVRLALDNVQIVALLINTAIYVMVSLRTEPRLVDRVQAAAFVGPDPAAPTAAPLIIYTTVGELRALIETVLGVEDAARAFADYEAAAGETLSNDDAVSVVLARAAERMLAGAIGASSARNLIGLALAGDSSGAPDVRRMLDEAAQAVQFSRELLQSSIDSLDEGVCVVDHDLRLVAWNSQYLGLFEFGPGEVYVGVPLQQLIERQTKADGMDEAAVERYLDARLGSIRRRERQLHERTLANGMTVRVNGTPTSTGEYVMSFTDVTELRESARVLAQANELLEQRVAARTSELSAAKAVAERATNAQARFVAAASHDLLQPLHAARLFLGAAAEDLRGDQVTQDLVAKADVSIESADRLLRALLNLSRLEVDGLKPEFAPVELHAILDGVARDFRDVAREKGVGLSIGATSTWILSDPDLLRSVLQNLVSNAVRYTPPGGRVLVGCRRAQGVRIEVWDTGPGIAEHELPMIFHEFSRLPGGLAAGSGAGLGLAIAERVCGALGHSLEVRSKVGLGSLFSVTAPRAQPCPVEAPSQRADRRLGCLRVLCLDDEPSVLESMGGLMRRWGVQPSLTMTAAEARALDGPWDVVLADYHLGGTETGLDFLKSLDGARGSLALLTANSTDQLLAEATALNVALIRKPLAPAALRAFLTSAAAAAEVKD